MLMLYGVAPIESVPPVLDSEPGTRLAVLYERRRTPPSYCRDEVLRFAQRVLALPPATVLPMRYGTVVAGREELQELVAVQEEVWLERLARVGGHDELIVHWELPPLGAGDGSGTSYLMERVARARSSTMLREELDDGLRELVSETRLLRGWPVRVACLVPRESVDGFPAVLEGWARGRPGSIWWTGPWPPFSFAEPEVDS
jgi:hypothetical protein